MELSELIARIDIVEFISKYVELEEKNGEFWGLSPFKEEKTPSFSVRRENRQWYDFSSGQGGNILHFVEGYFKCSTREAVEIMKGYAGLDGELVSLPDSLSATNVAKKFSKKQKTVKESKGVVLDENCMDVYMEDKEKLQIWLDEGISYESLERFQVKYDTFSNRLVYPIRDMSGRIVNIGGRTIAPNWKERGLRKYTYFYPWGTINTIYGLIENMEYIEKKGEVILFEGCKSVLLADTWGIKNAGAILTSHLSGNQTRILCKLAKTVVFALDNDVNVLEDKNIDKLKHFVNVFYIYDSKRLLDEKDAPVDKGKEVFKELYENKRRLY